MEQNRTPAYLTAVAYHAAQSHEAAEDFSLPDYMPAVRRVVSVEAVPLPENRFLSGDALEFGGTLAFSVLYVGEGGELYCAPLTTEYTASTALAGCPVTDAAAVGVDTVAETVTCRVTAPRRLTLKCRMRSKLTALTAVSVADRLTETAGGRITPADELAIERLIAETPDVETAHGTLTATVGGTLPGTAKVIRCAGAVRVEEATAAADVVTVRGDVILTAVVLAPEGVYRRVTAKSPFTETVTVPGAQPGDAARAWGRAAAVTVTPGEEETAWEIEFDLESETARAAVRAYTADLFSTDCAAAVEWKETDSLALLRCGQSALTVSGEGGRQSKPAAASPETILDARAVCTPEQLECRDGRLLLTGTCAVSVLLLADGDVLSEEFSLPFRYECDAAAPADELLWRASVETVGVNARCEGDKLAVTLELCVSLCALSRTKIRCVETAALTKSARRETDDGCIRICYPDEGEPLWEIAKAYGVSRQTIRAENALPDTAASCDGTPILI